MCPKRRTHTHLAVGPSRQPSQHTEVKKGAVCGCVYGCLWCLETKKRKKKNGLTSAIKQYQERSGSATGTSPSPWTSAMQVSKKTQQMRWRSKEQTYLQYLNISETQGSRKRHQRIWEGPIACHTFVQKWSKTVCGKLRGIAVSLKRKWCAHWYGINLHGGYRYLGRSDRLPHVCTISENQCPSKS